MIKGFDQLLTNLKQLEEVCEATLIEAGNLAVDIARSTTLFHHGNAFDEGIKFIQHNKYQGTVVSEASYSEWLEYGNNEQGPFIYPVTAKALHFFINGEEIFVSKVKSHGPLPFMEQTENIILNELPTIFERNRTRLAK